MASPPPKKESPARIILAQFDSGNVMPYYAEEELEIGDYVIIVTNKGKLKIVQVIQTEGIDPTFIKKTEKSILQSIDMENYKAKIQSKNE